MDAQSTTQPLLSLLRDIYAAQLHACGDQQATARLAVVDHFGNFSLEHLRQIGVSAVRMQGDGYVGQLTDGTLFTVAADAGAAPGSMQPSSYGIIGATKASQAEMAAGIAAERMTAGLEAGASF